VLHSLLLGAELQGTSTTIDFLGDEDIRGGLTVMEVAESVGGRYCRSASLESVLRELAALVATRTSEGNYRDATHLLVLFGLQRALSLTPHDPYSMDAPDEPSIGQLLSMIMVGGPEVGVHVVVDVDHLRAAEARLGPDLIQELMIRVAGSSTDAKDLSLVSGTYEASSPLRFGQILIGDHLKGTNRRARAYRILNTPPNRILATTADESDKGSPNGE
jgi:hypothetical protein